MLLLEEVGMTSSAEYLLAHMSGKSGYVENSSAGCEVSEVTGV